MDRDALARGLVRALFALLVASTFAAFFVAQRVKRSQPVVEKVRFTRWLSPNGDGVRDQARLAFRLKRTDRVDVAIVNPSGDLVTTLVENRSACGPCTHRFRWDGRTDERLRAADGIYHLRVTLRGQGRAVTSPRKLFLDTRAPRPLVRFVTPNLISPDGDGRGESARVIFEGPDGAGPGGHAPEFVVYRTGHRAGAEVARFRGRRGSQIGRWDGRIAGRPAPPGSYLIAVRVRDAAGNLGSGPSLPPRRDRASGRPGVIVRYIAAKAPGQPVRAGGRARFRIETDRPGYRWAIRAVGARRNARSGRSRVRVLRPRVPRRPGVYELRLRVGSHRYATPFAVEAPGRRRVLVVLPLIAWQSANLWDADEDGWGETLAASGSVLLRRPFAFGGSPPGFAREVTPLLALLRRERLGFDVTTDLALARGAGPAPSGHAGVLFAGDERYLPAHLRGELRDYVEGGGRIATLSPEPLRRDVRITGRRILEPGAREERDAFGERTSFQRLEEPGPMTVLSDRVGFFAQSGTAFGHFGRLEVSGGLPAGARLLAAAGREIERPAMLTYRLGRGVVYRSGGDGLVEQMPLQPGVERVVLRLWTLLSR